jgi:hypothetical protein
LGHILKIRHEHSFGSGPRSMQGYTLAYFRNISAISF